MIGETKTLVWLANIKPSGEPHVFLTPRQCMFDTRHMSTLA